VKLQERDALRGFTVHADQVIEIVLPLRCLQDHEYVDWGVAFAERKWSDVQLPIYSLWSWELAQMISTRSAHSDPLNAYAQPAPESSLAGLAICRAPRRNRYAYIMACDGLRCFDRFAAILRLRAALNIWIRAIG